MEARKGGSDTEKVIDYQYIRNLKNKEVRKSRFKRTFSQRIFRMILIIILIGELSYLAARGFQIVEHSNAFILKDVAVTGAHKTDADQVKAIIFATQRNTLQVDLKQIQVQLEAQPWVQSTILWRELPGTIHVHIIERKPVAIVSTGHLYLVDPAGRVIEPLEEDSEYANLPVITGVSDVHNQIQIRSSLDFVQEVAADPGILHQISEFHYYDKYNTIVYIKGYTFGLLVAKDGILPMIRKFANYSGFMKDNFSSQKLIDLRYDGQIVVKDAYKEQL
jgi:POTRA domain-containing FtsQ-type protein/cell division protein FtsQ